MLLLHDTRGKLALPSPGVYFQCYLVPAENNLFLDVISEELSPLMILSSIKIVQGYLIVPLSDFLLQFSLRLFVCGNISFTVSDPMPSRLSFAGLFQILLLILNYFSMS